MSSSMSTEGGPAGVAPSRYDAFLSFSRGDHAFVKRLVSALEDRGKSVWWDERDVPAAADWQATIREAIQAARALIVVLSPDAVASRVVGDEVATAAELNKRIVPVLYRDLDRAELDPELERRSWVFLRESDDFEGGVETVVRAIETDLEWLDMHARLAVRAREWEDTGRDRSYLLRGTELRAAEEWLASAAQHAELPTQLHTQYIVASRQRPIFGGLRRRAKAPSQAWPASAVSEEAAPAQPAAAATGEPGDKVEWVNDAPASTDLLQRRPLARSLAERLKRIRADDPTTSFLMHIDGAWGTGKSTILSFMRDELEGSGWLVVEFNAWRQSRVGPPWWALLVALRNDIARSLGRLARIRLRVGEAFGRIRRTGAPYAITFSVVVAAAAGLIVAFWPLSVRTTGDVARTATSIAAGVSILWAGGWLAARFLLWESAAGARVYEQSQANPMETLVDHFAWLVRRSQRPVVFFLDDLDRCSGPYVVELLEAVQTLLRDATGGRATVRRRARAGLRRNELRYEPQGLGPYFVAAADGAWIRTSFEIEYNAFAASIEEPGRPLGYLFLDKLFQLSVKVPSVGPGQLDPYLAGLLQSSPEPEPEEVGERVRRLRARLRGSRSDAEVVDALREAGDARVRRAVASDAVEQLTSPAVQQATEHALQKFTPFVEPNPRSMKRFVNAFGVARVVLTLENRLLPSDSLALLTLLRTRWPLLSDHLERRPADVALVGEPSASLDGVPANLRALFGAPEVVALVRCKHGGPLTEDLVRHATTGPGRDVGEAPELHGQTVTGPSGP